MLNTPISLPLKWTQFAVTIAATGVGQAIASSQIAARVFFILPESDNVAVTGAGPTKATAEAAVPLISVPQGTGWQLPYVGQPIDLQDFFVAGTQDDVVHILYM